MTFHVITKIKFGGVRLGFHCQDAENSAEHNFFSRRSFAKNESKQKHEDYIFSCIT